MNAGRRLLLAVVVILVSATGVAADPARDAILESYAGKAMSDAAGFEGFSAARARRSISVLTLGGNPQTPACASCHGSASRA
ncbi:MAG: hypothetical protein HC834_11165, partial [Rhodospirillales bacterium]|nr:hypothetical protein [Rhodospirillales bacterium]